MQRDCVESEGKTLLSLLTLLFERLRGPSVLLDDRCHVLLATDAARRQFDGAIELTPGRRIFGTMVAGQPKIEIAMATVLECLQREPASKCLRAARIEIGGELIELVVQGFRSGQQRALLVSMYDLESIVGPDMDAAARLFGLTPRETQVAGGVVAGKSTDEIAQDL